MPSDVRDSQADPLAVRETFESSLSLRALLRGCTAEGRPSDGRRKQGCDEWGAHGSTPLGMSRMNIKPPLPRRDSRQYQPTQAALPGLVA